VAQGASASQTGLSPSVETGTGSPPDGASIPSAYGKPVADLDDLETLDSDEVVEGYHDGRAGEPEPKGNRSRSYWHGWRNGAMDGGHIEQDAASAELARAYVARGRLG
jgi:hypothetical protein